MMFKRWLLWIAGAGVLGLIFMAYAQPSLVQHLADQLWACF
ncbi:hypothetical protein [Pelomonas sp. V22]|nr:hypothetical protein [Pelomonas sp. V22]